MPKEPIFSRVLVEQNQGHETRQSLFGKIQRHLKRPVVSFFSNMGYGVLLDSDADMLQQILQEMDLSAGLALVINGPGGDGIAAERMINVCRTYSGTNDYWAIVPGKAKSAATMVCFGASKIIMSGTSELGPVDPQVAIKTTRPAMFSVHNLVNRYKTLFQEAVKSDGNLEPYLQQLDRFDVREIAEFEAALKLSEDIALRSLQSGMMKDVPVDEIKEKIKVFTVPDQVLSHARPIGNEEAMNCGLNVETVDVRAEWWKSVNELYVRTNHYVSGFVLKAIESQTHSFYIPFPKEISSNMREEE